MFCRKCGASISDDFKLCPHCGTACNSVTIQESNGSNRKGNIKKVIAILFIVVGIASIVCGIAVMSTSESYYPRTLSASYYEKHGDVLGAIAQNSAAIVGGVDRISSYLHFGNSTNALAFMLMFVVAGAVLILHGISRYVDEKQCQK